MLSRFAGISKTCDRPNNMELNSGEVQFEGPLEKRGYWNPAWKSRYFVLSRQGVLSYFATKSDKNSPEPLGSFTVRNAIITCIPSAPGRPQFTVQVHSPGSPVHGRTFILVAPSDDALTRWVRELNRAARPESDAARRALLTAAAAGAGAARNDG